MSGIHHMLLMGGGATFQLTGQTLYDGNIGGAVSHYQLENTGKVWSITTTSGSVLLEMWVNGSFSASNYEAVATLVSGTLTGGTVGTAVNLSTTPDWYVQFSGVGTKTCTFDVIIRPAGGGTTLASARIILTAQGF